MKNLARILTHAFHSANLPVLAMTVAIGLAMHCTRALSQSDSGIASIQGTVTDSTGAVLPNVAIRVVNRATNVATDTKSNSVGFYQAPGLFAGDYSVTFTAQGFKTYTATLELLVSQAAVVNPVMITGAVTQQVNVTADTVQLTNPDNTDINTTLENQRINQLPMNGRLTINLISEITPGMENSDTNYMGYAGLPITSIDFVADGASTMEDEGFIGAQGANLDPDSVQEVRVEALDAGAQYSEPTVAIMTTKSGTNSLHGSFFETARNNGLGIAKTRTNPPVFSAPKYIRNEFGASAGGPIVLPHVYHGKDKSFWFFAYERYSLAQISNVTASEWTPSMEQGNFSNALVDNVNQLVYDPSTTAANAACPTPAVVAGVEVYNGGTPANNPYCRTPFSGNTIPAGELSPVTKVYFALMPPPTNASNPFVTTNFTGSIPVLNFIPSVTFRLDHEFNDKNRAYLRYTMDLGATDTAGSSTAQPRSLAYPALGIPAGEAEGYSNAPQSTIFAAAGFTHVFSPTFFSETIASQNWEVYGVQDSLGKPTNYEGELGLPSNFGRDGLPQMGGTTLTPNITSTSQNFSGFDQLVSVIEENLTKTAGKHQILFGGRFRHDRFAQTGSGTADAISFSGDSTADYQPSSGANYNPWPNTGVPDSSFFIGSAATYSVNPTLPSAHYHWMDWDGYVQDNFHITKNLTANLGVRWEDRPGIWSKDGLIDSFDFKNDAMVLPEPVSTLISEGYTTQAIITNMQNDGAKFETTAEAGMPSKIFRNYNLNFLPRVGLAYLPFGGKHGTVIRGAWGRYIFASSAYDFGNQPQNKLPFVAGYTQSYLATNQAIDNLPNELLRYNDPVQFGVMGVNTANVVNSNVTNAILPGAAGYNTWSIDPNFAPNFVDETNFTIEQPLKGNSALRVSWVWVHTSNTQLTFPFNEHPSTYQWEMATGTVLPTGTTIDTPTYAATATGPYDQTTWGSASTWYTQAGWENTNQFQATYQRIFHRGIAYQISYVWAKSLIAGGDQHLGGDGQILSVAPYANYPGGEGTIATMTSPYGTVGPSRLPPPPPTGTPVWAEYHALNDWTDYERNANDPPMHITGNGIIDLPVGTGKRLMGNANRFVNELVGGFEIAGDANIQSEIFQVSTAYDGPTAPIHVYKHKVPVTNCTSGVCYKQYLWFNGYIPPTQNANVDCTTNCISGIPANYQPYASYIDSTPGTTYYDTNEVAITAPGINKGAATPIVYDQGPYGNVNQHTYINGPVNWTADASVFKVLPITERMNLRFNMDVFNLFNVQGYNNPAATTGLESIEPGVSQATSHNAARQLQLTLRLSF